MVNNESARLEIIDYDSQEAKRWRKESAIAVEPLAWWNPLEEEAPPIHIPTKEEEQGNGSTRKRKRAYSVVVGETKKSFTLLELYDSDNIKHIVQREIGETVDIDPQKLLMNLQGWTIKTKKHQPNHRYDKVYKHPNTEKSLRCLPDVKKFIVENSCTRNTTGQGGSTAGNMDDNTIGVMPKSLESEGRSMPSLSSQSSIYLQVFQRYKDVLDSNCIDQQNRIMMVQSQVEAQVHAKVGEKLSE